MKDGIATVEGEKRHDAREAGHRPGAQALHRRNLGNLHLGDRYARGRFVARPPGRPGPIQCVSLDEGRALGGGTGHAPHGWPVSLPLPGDGLCLGRYSPWLFHAHSAREVVAVAGKASGLGAAAPAQREPGAGDGRFARRRVDQGLPVRLHAPGHPSSRLHPLARYPSG